MAFARRSWHAAVASVRRPAGAPFLVIAFMVLLIGAWVFANPPGYAPDEPAHYTKALSVGRGQWAAPAADYPIGPGFGPPQLRWINQVATAVEHPPHMAMDAFACSVFNPEVSAKCLYQARPPAEAVTRLTYVGTYEPFLYVPAGLAMRPADDAFDALRLGRMATAAICMVLLALAAWVLWRPGQRGYSMIGLVATVTPMVVFLSSELSTSGPEVTATICFTAVLLRLARPELAPGRVWVAGAVSGAVLGMSRSIGPFLLVADLLIFLVLVGPRGAWRIGRRAGRAALAATAAVVLGVAANVAWGVAVQPQPGLPPIDDALGEVGPTVRQLPEILRQVVGIFGWQDVNMPLLASLAWGGLVAALIVVAFVIGQWRQRLTLAAVTMGCVVGTLVMALLMVQNWVYGFPLYGRYFLPLWVTLPLCAGEVAMLNRHRLAPFLVRGMLPAVAVVAAAVHVTAWWSNARRYAVSDNGPIFFLGHSEWRPVGTWLPWLALVAAAAVCLVCYGLATGRHDPVAETEGRSRPLAPREEDDSERTARDGPAERGRAVPALGR